jgi:hypothetical protein
MPHWISARRTRLAAALTVFSFVWMASPGAAEAQRGGRGRGGATARAGAAIDLTGYWVSVVTEDWKFRMVTPNAGVYDGLTLNAEGRRVADSWDPEADEAAGEACRSYGAAAIMRVPGRLHITWEDDDTLRIDTDSGMQTRRLHFAPGTFAVGDPTWQGYSVAEWERAPSGAGGSLKVVTTAMRPGYVRKNGAPYSGQTVLTEYFDVNTLPNGDQWLTVTSLVDDPVFFSRALLTTSDFKKLPDDSGWDPTPCSAR